MSTERFEILGLKECMITAMVRGRHCVYDFENDLWAYI